MKKEINLALNALALAGMLVFAAQTADAANTPSSSPDVPTAAQNTPDTSPDVAEVDDIGDASEVAEVDAQDIETPDVGEIDSVSEIETEGPESH
jgi:hypothetical protein